MSTHEPTKPYVCQPYGPNEDKERGKLGRIYGVSGVSLYTVIKGLTKEEADKVAAALQK